eukprot:Hpha_TRINITY_DN7711_c0_g1::TRINITY_DN7711_c0_g1_i1::g.85315::m.85315
MDGFMEGIMGEEGCRRGPLMEAIMGEVGSRRGPFTLEAPRFGDVQVVMEAIRGSVGSRRGPLTLEVPNFGDVLPRVIPCKRRWTRRGVVKLLLSCKGTGALEVVLACIRPLKLLLGCRVPDALTPGLACMVPDALTPELALTELRPRPPTRGDALFACGSGCCPASPPNNMGECRPGLPMKLLETW